MKREEQDRMYNRTRDLVHAVEFTWQNQWVFAGDLFVRFTGDEEDHQWYDRRGEPVPEPMCRAINDEMQAFKALALEKKRKKDVDEAFRELDFFHQTGHWS